MALGERSASAIGPRTLPGVFGIHRGARVGSDGHRDNLRDPSLDRAACLGGLLRGRSIAVSIARKSILVQLSSLPYFRAGRGQCDERPELLSGFRYSPTSGRVVHHHTRRALVIPEANLVSSARHVPGVQSGHPIRVLYVEANEDGTVGGSYQALYDLVRTVPRHRVEPVVLFYQDNGFADRLRAKGITVLSYESVRASERGINKTAGVMRRRLAQVGAIIRRFRLLQRERVDLLHLNNGPTIGVDDWLPAAKLARIPCVVNAMGLPVKERRALSRLLSWRFDRIIAISNYMQNRLREDGFPVHRVATIPLSVDIGEFRSRVGRSRNAVRATLVIPPDAFVVTMVGNIPPVEGAACARGSGQGSPGRRAQEARGAIRRRGVLG